MKAGLALVLFGVCGVGLVVASGTASPVVYGLGDATPGVAATGVISSLVALLSGGGGVWAMLKAIAPQSSKLIDAVQPVLGHLRPIITDDKLKDTASLFVEEIFGGKLDAGTLTEEGALLFVTVCRAKAGDGDGKDQAFNLLQHIREQGKPTTRK